MRVFGLFGLSRWKGKALRPGQVNTPGEQEKVDEIVSEQDARYDAMTEAERDEYYMKPKLTTRIKKALRGQ